MAVDDWALLKTSVVTLVPTEEIVGGWKQVSSMPVTLTPSEQIIAGWKQVKSMSLTLEPSESIIAGWKMVKTMNVTLTLPTVECSIDADCPEGYICVDGKCVKKGAGFPWGAVAGTAAAVGGIVLIAKPRRKPTKGRKKKAE